MSQQNNLNKRQEGVCEFCGFVKDVKWVGGMLMCEGCEREGEEAREKHLNHLKEIFTLENATKHYKKYSEENCYKCSWVDGLEGEMIQFAFKSGEEIVVERIHIDDLEDAGDWDHVSYQHGTEMSFSKNDLSNLLIHYVIWSKEV